MKAVFGMEFLFIPKTAFICMSFLIHHQQKKPSSKKNLYYIPPLDKMVIHCIYYAHRGRYASGCEKMGQQPWL